jgi:hypothetical protein
MPNAALDSFLHALIWKAAPVVFLAGIAGLILRELIEWFERWLTRAVRSRHAARHALAANTQQTEEDTANACPLCKKPMVKRKARRGSRKGEMFWGCSNFPTCRGTRPA